VYNTKFPIKELFLRVDFSTTFTLEHFIQWHLLYSPIDQNLRR